jgi:quinol monooxygenase YgiN
MIDIMPEPRKSAAFVVLPEFVVKPDCIDAFLALAHDDASHSLADEPGCQQFDIVQMEGAPCHVLFYEVYNSRAAFDAHLRTPHLSRFREGFPALVIEERTVRFASRRHG